VENWKGYTRISGLWSFDFHFAIDSPSRPHHRPFPHPLGVVEACAGSGKTWLLATPFGLIFPDNLDAITN